MDDPSIYLGRLKPIHLFKGLSDDQIIEAAKELVVERHPAGDTIFEQGAAGDSFYIIDRGQVKVLRKTRGENKPVATLVPGDFFGEGAVLYGRKRSATIEAATEVELLRLSKEDFDSLLKRFPQIRPNLLLTTESLELFRRNAFRWLGANEVVYLIARKHRLLLFQAWVAPVIVGSLIALASIWTAVLYEQLWIAWVGAALEAFVALWLVWVTIDWGNDFYIITNQRLVHLEKIVGIYDSRVEAPLASVMSVDVQTDDFIQRQFRMGDVIVRTFSGPITLKSVSNPVILAAAIEEHWQRTRNRARESQLDQMRVTIKDRLERGPTAAAPVRRPPKPEAPKPTVPLGQQLATMFSFQVRFEQGNSVIYRKHWFMLFQKVWKPSLGLLAVIILATVLAGGWLITLPITAVLLVGFVAFIPLAGWWLYEYVDWRNDIYQITEDQIFDISKKPLGAETKKSAPLGNVLSLKYERPGLIGVALNFGTVVAQVAGTEFRFEGVFDPVAVQNDVYRRIEAQKNKKESAEEARKRDEMADWLTVYHQVQEERRKGAKPAP
jgi:hypothetical protein